MAADSPSLIASGQFDEAEQEIEKVIRSFWLFRSVKLLSLHHLAVLRHALVTMAGIPAILCRGPCFGQQLTAASPELPAPRG